MKKLLQYFYLASMVLVSTNLHSCAQTTEKTYSDIDFFKDTKYLITGEISLSRNQKPGYGSIPKLSYDKKGVGMCEIICLPNNLKAWQARVQKIRDSLMLLKKLSKVDKIGPMIFKIATDPVTQKKHSIYAFYTREQNVALESDLESKIRMPQFPSFVYVYKREDKNWLLLKRVFVKDWSACDNLKFNTVILKKLP